jgi:hypothetical protein
MTQDLSLLRPGMALSLAAALSASLALPAIGGDALQSAAQPSGPQVGETVAPFEAEAVGGTMQHVAFPRGSATVLLFFLSGCPSCHQMIPEWSRAYDRKPPGLTVWGVIMDKEPGLHSNAQSRACADGAPRGPLRPNRGRGRRTRGRHSPRPDIQALRTLTPEVCARPQEPGAPGGSRGPRFARRAR